VQGFECRLDDGSFEDCSSPHNVSTRLSLGRHVLAVRATDFAGNRGSVARYAWVVQGKKGPVVSIAEGPDPLTNQTRADFEIDAGNAVRLECHIDDDDFESCPTLFSQTVDEGDHTFVVRGLDADGITGLPAEYRWTVDTTAPTVEIDSAERTSAETADVAFTPSESELRIECVLLEPHETGAVEVARQSECTTPTTFDGLLSDLAYVVRVLATDAAGNVGSPSETDIEAWSTVD
jgi:hypothetical protein